MTNNDMVITVLKIIAEIAHDLKSIEKMTVSTGDTLEGLGIDSLDRHEIALQIEQHFNIDIEDGVPEAWSTVQDVIDSVSNELTGTPSPFAPDGSYDTTVSDGRDAPPVINRIMREDVNFTKECWNNPYYTGRNAFDTYQSIATKSAIYPGQGTPLGLDYVALKINGEAGEFAEHVGKAMRDDALISVSPAPNVMEGYVIKTVVQFEPLTDTRRTAIVKELGDILWYLSAAANELNMTLSEIALANLEKLCDRTERDALRGSGDER